MSWMKEKNLTNSGLALIAKAQLGTEIKFTRMALGDGYMPNGFTPENMTKMTHEIASIEISKLNFEEPHTATVGGWYTNEELTEDFYFRELGLFAEDPDDGEILYAYGNALDTAEFIPSHESGTLVEKALDIVTYIGNAADVTATLASNIYVSQRDYSTKIASLEEENASLNDSLTEANEKIKELEDARDSMSPRTLFESEDGAVDRFSLQRLPRKGSTLRVKYGFAAKTSYYYAYWPEESPSGIVFLSAPTTTAVYLRTGLWIIEGLEISLSQYTRIICSASGNSVYTTANELRIFEIEEVFR